MPETLKLTITAVGETGSVFVQPCEPITLHESETSDDRETETETETETEITTASESVATAEDVDDVSPISLTLDETTGQRQAS